MASDEISELANALSKTNVGDGELSYKGKRLKLDNVGSDEILGSMEEMVFEITQYHGLRVLCLEGNTIGVEAAQAIAKALENKYELQRCYWSDMFTGRLRSEIPTALMSLGSALMIAGARLTELDLSDNAFGPDGLKGIEQLLKSPSCHSLKELRLNNCGMGIGGGKILAEALMECHRCSSAQGASLRLRVFHAGRNRLENEGACALAQAFQSVGSLVEVHMPQNGIAHAGITALASALQHNTGLRVLNLNDNTFTNRGALAMAQALTHLKNVQAVNFGDCLVRSEGAIALAAVLREGLPILKELNLSFGEIMQGAALVVAHAVMEKPHMEKVDLNGNCLGEEGCEALRETMENMGKGHMLASLSDDEGEPDEEENGIDEEEENGIEENWEEEAENWMKEEEGKIVKENGVTSGGNRPAKPPCPLDLVSFLCCPTAEVLLELGEKRTSLSQLVDICEPEHAADVFLKISSMYGEDPETKTAVLETIDSVLKKLLCGSTTLQAYCFLSSLLDRMGLLKGECKAKKMPLVPGQLLCLEHAIQEEYFSQDHALLLHIFICRNAALLKSCGGAAELLNTALEQRCGPEK